jgi:adenosylcobinamide-phosphate synthase
MLAGLTAVEVAALLLVGALLDRLLGEPRRWHPLVGFGHLAAAIERGLNRAPAQPLSRLTGIVAWMLAVLPFVLCLVWLIGLAPAAGAYAIHAAVLAFTLGARSLGEHIAPIGQALAACDLARARELTARIVSRDTRELDAGGVARAAVESALENGNDAIFGALFWFMVAGAPGALLFRLANTLDAMWGYKTPRHLRFGWAAARIDDLLNLLPARLTALTYAVLGRTGVALACWRAQAPAWESPNAGPVMAAGAGALELALGGPAVYHGQLEARPPLGTGSAPAAPDIFRALRLIERGIWLWLAGFSLCAALTWSVAHA